MARSIRVSVAFLGMVFCAISLLRAERLNIDLGAIAGIPSIPYGAAPNQSGTWNTVGLGSTSNLLDLSGSPTSVDISVTADTDDGAMFGCGGDLEALIGDNIYSSGPTSTWSVILTGMADGAYRVYLYAPFNTAVATGNMTVNGTPVVSITGNDCSLTEGLTYVSVPTTVSGGTISITGDATGTGFDFSGLAGLQIVKSFHLNVDLGSTLGTPSDPYGAAANQSGTWNTVGLGSSANLLDLSGSPTSVGISVTADADTGFLGGCGGDLEALIGDHIHSAGATATWSVNLTGFEDGAYRVYLYAPYDSVVATGNMTVNGTPVASITGNDCSLTEGLTYVSVATTVSGGTISITGDATGTGFDFSGLAGLQVVALVFSDGFESGDTSAWSATVP